METKKKQVHICKKFADGNIVGGWSSPYIAGLVKGGYVSGLKDNTIQLKKNITRAEFVKVLDNMIALVISKPGKCNLSDVKGIVVINVPGVIITGVSEDTKIYLTSGSNEEVEYEVKNDENIEDADTPQSVLIGSVSNNIDYTVFNPTSEELAQKKLAELKMLYGMPTASSIVSMNNMQYWGKIKGTDQWNDLILKISNEEKVDPVFVKCIMALESGGTPGVKSKQNSNGTYDYGLMQVNTSWGSNFDYNRMLVDNEYAIRCGILVIKRKIEMAECGKNGATVHEVAWRYCGYNSKGLQYANKLSSLYEELSGKPKTTLVRSTLVS